MRLLHYLWSVINDNPFTSAAVGLVVVFAASETAARVVKWRRERRRCGS